MYIGSRTFSFCLNVSGRTVPLILAKVSNIFNASSIRPLASNHLGDSGKNLQRKIKLYVRLYAITSGHATDAHGTRAFYNKVTVSMFDRNNEYFNLPPVYKVQCKRSGRRQRQVYPIAHVVRNSRQQHQTECIEHARHHSNKRSVIWSDELQS